MAATRTTVSSLHSGPLPPAASPAPPSAGRNVAAARPGSVDAPAGGASGEASPDASASPSSIGAPLPALVVPSGGDRGGGGGSPQSSSATGDSLLSWLGGSGQRLAPGARVRPPVAPVVRPDVFVARHRVFSVLTRGLKVRVPVLAPPVWRSTPRSALMGAAIADFVAAGVLRPGRPTACYRLFPVPKSATVARLVYDLSLLTPLLPCRPCYLPSVENALELSSCGYNFGIKIDLRDGFYHIPLARSSQSHFGVLYDHKTYLFTRLPMGLKIAPSEMQFFADAVAEVVQARFYIKCLAYLDDFVSG